MKPLFPLLVASFALLGTAQAQETPGQTVETVFEGMRKSNGDLIRSVVDPDTTLLRVEADGSVTASSFQSWVEWIDTQVEGDANEEVFNMTVSEFGNIANVTAPFTFTYQGELVSCGVNHFTLAKDADGWRVIHGVDTEETGGDCATFKDRYTASR